MIDSDATIYIGSGKKDDQHGSISYYQIFEGLEGLSQRQIAKKLNICDRQVIFYSFR